LITLITSKNDLSLDIKDLHIKRINNPEEFSLNILDKVEGLILDSRNIKYSLPILSKIRSSSNPEHYLKPIFLFSDSNINDEYTLMISDGQVDFKNILSVFPSSQRINNEIKKFENLEGHLPETGIVLKALRLMVSRQVDMKPIIMPKSRFGYIYPFLSVNFKERDDIRIFRILKIFEDENLTDYRFVDRVRLCNKCYSSFLNLREVCPKCGSYNLTVEDLIHHFHCGHVERESKFINNSQLVCPKCERILRHIGMDYDKPSIIYYCNDCHYSFQEPEIWAFCFYCKNSSPVDSTIVKDINSYHLSQASENFATNGIFFSLSDYLSKEIELVEYNFFQTILKYEQKRQKRYNSESTVVYLYFKDFEEKFIAFGEKREKIAFEIADLIKDSLRDSDIITALSENTFALLLIESDIEKTNSIMKRIKERINELIEANFKDEKIKIEIDCMTLEKALKEQK